MKSQSEQNSNTDSQSELVSELRTLLSQVRTADFDQRINDGEPLDDLIDKIRLIRKELSPYQVEGERMQAGLRPQEHFFRPDTGKDYDLRGLQPEDFFPYSPIIGPYNPIAPPFRFSMEDGIMHATGNFDSQYCGPPEGVHGGYVAALMDELLGVTCVMNGHGGYTGTLTIRYISPTPLDVELTATAQVKEIKDRKAIIIGELKAGDRLCAEAEGIFIKPNLKN